MWRLYVSSGSSSVTLTETPQSKYSDLNRIGFLGEASGNEPACQCRRCKRHRVCPWVGKIPWRRAWLPTPVFLPGESHGQGSLAGYSPPGRKESDTTERLHFTSPHLSLKCCIHKLDVEHSSVMLVGYHRKHGRTKSLCSVGDE